ncbi:MAG: hypothetical protein CL912_21440 [Deltaproteobacteria bacterium]|nr:hypothetical protein [Deltaproteobacteria bacterium]
MFSFLPSILLSPSLEWTSKIPTAMPANIFNVQVSLGEDHPPRHSLLIDFQVHLSKESWYRRTPSILMMSQAGRQAMEAVKRRVLNEGGKLLTEDCIQERPW